MPLSTAPLGNLPYMNLARYVPDRYVEPAWHRALSAFLVNSAASAGKDFVGNAMTPDMTKAAIAKGYLPPDTPVPGTMGHIMGAGFTPREYETAARDFNANKAETDRNAFNMKTEGDRTDILKGDAAERARHDKADEDAGNKHWSVEEQRYNEEANDRKDTATNRAAALSEQTRRDKANEEREARDEDRRERATNANVEAEHARTKAETDRDEMIKKAFGDQGAPTAGADHSAAPNNQSSIDFNSLVTPTVPGSPGAPNTMEQMLNHGGMNSMGMPNSALVQPSGGPQTQNPGTGPIGATPGQQGQASPILPGTPPVGAPNTASSFSPQNLMQQGLGQQGGSPLTGVPANPLGMSNAPATAANYVPPFQFDPKVMMAAYALARAKGQPQGIGGTPGAGGLPLGYG